MIASDNQDGRAPLAPAGNGEKVATSGAEVDAPSNVDDEPTPLQELNLQEAKGKAEKIPLEKDKLVGELEKLPLERDKLSAEIEKLASEQEKLQLERQSLSRQLSWYGEIREWLKAATVPAALIGVAATFFVGSGQIHEIQENRNADRFDKALARLASDKINERVTGVAGLRQFLTEGDENRKASTIYYLVNAVASETDTTVQGTLLDVLKELKDYTTDLTRNEALRAAVDRNRGFTRAILEGRYRQADRRYANPFYNISDIDRFRLDGLVKAINILLAQGAAINDFSGIFCDRCDFRPAKAIQSAIFNNSFLHGAKFSQMNLTKASFKNADIAEADFFAANLTGANLQSENKAYWQTYRDYSNLPVLECATLNGADLTGAIIASIDIWRYDNNISDRGDGGLVYVPLLLRAKTDSNTIFNSATIVIHEITVRGENTSSETTSVRLHIIEDYEPGVWEPQVPSNSLPLVIAAMNQPPLAKIPSVAAMFSRLTQPIFLNAKKPIIEKEYQPQDCSTSEPADSEKLKAALTPLDLDPSSSGSFPTPSKAPPTLPEKREQPLSRANPSLSHDAQQSAGKSGRLRAPPKPRTHSKRR